MAVTDAERRTVTVKGVEFTFVRIEPGQFMMGSTAEQEEQPIHKVQISRAFDLGNVKLAIGRTMLDWATVTLTCIDGEGFDKAGRILITATGHCQNTGWEMEQLGGDRITLRRRWGTEPVLCEGIPAEIALPVPPDRVKLYPLDESGHRRAAIAVAARDGKALLPLGPEHKTIWYEVEIR